MWSLSLDWILGCMFVIYDKGSRKVATIDGQAVSPTLLTNNKYNQLTRQNSELTNVVIYHICIYYYCVHNVVCYIHIVLYNMCYNKVCFCKNWFNLDKYELVASIIFYRTNARENFGLIIKYIYNYCVHNVVFNIHCYMHIVLYVF